MKIRRFLILPTAATLLFWAGATVVASPRATDHPSGYTPAFAPIKKGFRPIVPYFLAEVTFWSCESMDASLMQNIRDHFTHPLGEGTYYQFIAAIVVNGDYESVGTSFTVWLLDGRRLDSGLMFFGPDGVAKPGFKDSEIGQQMYARALILLHKAIPDSRLREAKKAVTDT